MAFGTSGRPSFGSPAPNASAILTQADQLRQQGRLAEAENLVRGVVGLEPNLPIALNMLALFVRARGDNQEAESLLRRAIALEPRGSALHNNLGNVLTATGDLLGAESAYRKAVELRADYPEAWHNLGLALKALGRSDAALAAFRRAVEFKKDYPQALVQVGVMLIERGESADALGPLETAAKLAPAYYDAHYYRGVALMQLNRFDEAIPILQRAVDIAPQRHEARYMVSKCFAHVGREEDALLGYQTAFERKPDFLPALNDFTALAFSMGNDVRSMQSFAYARGKAGDTPDLLLAEANVRMRLFDSVEAESLLRVAHNKAPERADIADALGRALVMQSRLDESFPVFQKALAADPESVRNRQDYAEALLKGGENAEAARILDEALTRNPHDQITLAYLALAWRETGDSRYDQLVNLDRYVREYEIAPPNGFTDIEAFNRALAEELTALHTRHGAPIDQTLQNGTQTTGSLFARKSRAIEAVRERIREAVAEYIAGLPDGAQHPMLARKDKDFAFSGSWSCRLHSTGFHSNHVHDQGWISSAYYASLPAEVADGDGGQGAIKFGESKFRLGERDRPGRVIKPAVGKLVLFPSYFWHGTVPFQSRDMRLTIAFDVVPGKRAPRAAFDPSV